jgi:hypothetical protein
MRTAHGGAVLHHCKTEVNAVTRHGADHDPVPEAEVLCSKIRVVAGDVPANNAAVIREPITPRFD